MKRRERERKEMRGMRGKEKTRKNDYTYVGPRGSSVRDYVVVNDTCNNDCVKKFYCKR